MDEMIDPGLRMTEYLVVVECRRGVVGTTTVMGCDPVDARDAFYELMDAGGPFEAGLTFDGLRDNCTEDELAHYLDAMIEGFKVASCVPAAKYAGTMRLLETMRVLDTVVADLAS